MGGRSEVSRWGGGEGRGGGGGVAEKYVDDSEGRRRRSFSVRPEMDGRNLFSSDQTFPFTVKSVN